MNRFIKFTGCALIFLTLGAPSSIHASCKEPSVSCGCKKPKSGPPGPTGPAGPAGPSFVTTYGTWNISAVTNIADGDLLIFNVDEISSGITTDGFGHYILSANGVYQVTFGIAPQQNPTEFDIKLNGVTVSGGIVGSAPDSPQILTVMFQAVAGDQISVVNNSGATVTIGTSSQPGSVAAYLSILQIH